MRRIADMRKYLPFTKMYWYFIRWRTWNSLLQFLGHVRDLEIRRVQEHTHQFVEDTRIQS